MRWRGRRESSNVEDRRGRRAAPMVGGGLGVIVIAIVIALLGGDPMAFLSQQNLSSSVSQVEFGGGGRSTSAADDERASFVKVVLADTEDVWNKLFAEAGKRYQEPRLILFEGRVESACGFASSASGPFYCPGDDQVYIDLSFFDELARRYGAPGDFAQAYVIAHEVGHHVQNLLGISRQVQSQRGRVSQEEYNALSVRLELQADFFAGVWAHHAERAKQILERGDVEEALRAATAIGDDTLQKQAQGYVVPESFTHGTAEQRVRWFYKGVESGRLADGDTFSIPNP